MRIYVAGHTGLVGSAITRAIDQSPEHSWVGKTHAELELFDKKRVIDFLLSEKPDAIILAAARVGGIMANSRYPVEFLSENIRIELNLLEAAHEANIERVLFLGSSCIYPKFSTQPIKEEFLLSGALEPTNEPYALAKIVGIKLINAYRKQFGRDWVSVMPCNIFGPGDNFDAESGHVLPALIKRFHEAKQTGATTIVLWGSGAPLREFLHADELAQACLFLLEHHHSDIHLNVGSGHEVSIKELANLVAEIVGYSGEIFWDHTKPDGTPRKVLDSSRLHALGWESKKSLRDGIEATYKWYREN